MNVDGTLSQLHIFARFMGAFRKLLFIINKHSGRGYQPRVEGKILDACARNNAECTLEFTQSPGHGRELASQRAHDYDAVIAVGGDGTVNEVVQGLVHTRTPLGIIPKGSGNGLARHLGIPMKYTDAVNSLFKSEPLLVDTFEVNGQTGVNVAGIGFDGHVANLFGKGTTRGLLGYAHLVVRELNRYRGIEAEVIADEERYHTHDFILAIANSSQYGNNAYIAPQASITDRTLNLVHVHRIPLVQAPVFLHRLFTRKLHNGRFYQSRECKQVRITTTSHVPFHIDGEPCGHTNTFEIRILPASLLLLVPSAHRTQV